MGETREDKLTRLHAKKVEIERLEKTNDELEFAVNQIEQNEQVV